MNTADKELARIISRWLNTRSSTDTGYQVAFALTWREHRTLQQNLMRDLVIPIIDLLADEHAEGFSDDRNEAAGKLATLIRDTVTKQGGWWPPPLPFI